MKNIPIKCKKCKIIEMAKNGLDSYEYCIQELEQENKKMKSVLEEINILAKNYCSACDEFKAKTYKNKNDCFYCNYGFIKNKINKVLESEEE